MFSPEDAMVLAYGSFGIDVSVSQVGGDTFVTNDPRLARVSYLAAEIDR
jgi:hypothetical protein